MTCPPFVDTKFVLHYFRGMKNVTVTLPEDVARWLRVRAAESGRSVSKWLAELIESMKRREDGYEMAMEQALEIEPEELNAGGEPYPSRESLHDRPGLR